MRFALVVLLGLSSTLAQAAGVQFIIVPADGGSPMLTGAVWSPCVAPPQEVTLHGVAAPGVMNCAIAGDRLPLIVISHGQDGWFGGHHDTAEALADAGFVVVAINHPGDNALSGNRTRNISIALERPVHTKRAIDFMLGAWSGAAKIDRDRIGFFGHSRGGYTGLVAAGGNPNFKRAAARCAEGSTTGSPCELLQNMQLDAGETAMHDDRIKALVIADPGFTFLLGPEELKEVKIPVQLWSSERGGAGGTLQSVTRVARWLPSRPDLRIVSNSSHWSFLAPCSPEQAKSIPRICTDAPDFDRAAFHQDFNKAVLQFFREHLPGNR